MPTLLKEGRPTTSPAGLQEEPAPALCLPGETTAPQWTSPLPASPSAQCGVTLSTLQRPFHHSHPGVPDVSSDLSLFNSNPIRRREQAQRGKLKSGDPGEGINVNKTSWGWVREVFLREAALQLP